MKVETYDLTAPNGWFVEQVPRRQAIRNVQDSIRLGQFARLAETV